MGHLVGGRSRRFISILGLALAVALLALTTSPAPGETADATAAKKKGGKKKGSGKGKKGGKKKGTKKYKGPKIETPNAGRCDFLDTSVCLHPWPNNFYVDRDKSTGSGRRLDLDARSMPENTSGIGIDPTDYNRNDGFSPGQAIVLHIDGLDDQAAFDRSGIVGIDDPADYKRKKQPVVVINTKTRERHPIFAEMDANPTDDANRNLIIRPLENWEEGQRYIVALRKLRDENGKKLEAPNAFRVYRDKLLTKQDEVEARRDRFEERIFKKIRKTKQLGRKQLYMAWDFTVASGEGLAERVLAMRDDAYERLGDTDLDDGVVQGDAPSFTVENVVDNPDSDTLRRVEGELTGLPCYLNQDGCAPGSAFMYDSDTSTMPTFDPSYTVDVPYRCSIPNSANDGGTANPARPALYGHGLLGSRRQAGSSYVVDFGNSHNIVHCAVNWDGFSEDDVLPVILPALLDLSGLSKTFDRTQQGFVNFMMLGRTMIHPDGFGTDPAFQIGGESVIDTEELYYYGNSQGGIMGGALTALAPDFTQSVLGVPGMNYSTLLRRSVDFDTYAVPLWASYPSEIERPLILGLMQIVWDRGEANGYAHHMTDDPYPDTPQHNVLLHAALGDHQVANITAEVEARTIRANVLEPALDPGRHWQANPFFQIPAIGSFPLPGSALVYWDGGPLGFAGTEGGGTAVPPNENVPPRPAQGFGADPHSYPRRADEAQQQMSDWLLPNGALQGVCAGGNPCYANGYAGP